MGPKQINTPSQDSQPTNKLQLDRLSAPRQYKITVAVLIIILAVGALTVFRHSSSTSKLAPSHNYKNTSAAQVNGGKASTTTTFLKPTEFKSSAAPTFGDDFGLPVATAFYQTNSNIKNGWLIVLSSPIDHPAPQNFLDSVKQTLSQPATSTAYINYLRTIKEFGQKAAGSNADVTLGHAQVFTNPNIANNAWQFSLNITDKKTGVSYAGTEVYAIGQKALYYFELVASTNNWQATANQPTWQNVLNSLKIDQ